MSVWISGEKLLIFASLISPSKMILFEKKYQTFDTVFHHQMKHLEVRQKYSAARRIFNSLLGVSSCDETLHLMFDILHDLPSAGFPQAALRSSFFMITTAFIAGCSFFCPSTASSIFSKIPFRFQEIRTINLLFHFFFYRSRNMLL